MREDLDVLDVQALRLQGLTKTADACLFCKSCRCFTRIWIVGLAFDEVACPEHVAALERFADAALPLGMLREHLQSSKTLRRTHSRQIRKALFPGHERELGRGGLIQ